MIQHFFFWSLIGSLMFCFRIYLVDFKLATILQNQRFYLSRLLNLLFWIFMIVNWESNILSISIFICFPAMVGSFFYFDIKSCLSIIQERNHDNHEKIWFLELLERVTLHLPIIITGLYSILIRNLFFLQKLTYIELFLGIGLNFLMFFLFDTRNPFRRNSKDSIEGGLLLCLNVFTVMGFLIIHYFCRCF